MFLTLNKKTEYALIALKYLMDNGEGRFVSVQEIATACTIPYDLLAKILQRLKNEHFLSSARGIQGGYAIDTNLESRSLLEIIDVLEPGSGLVACTKHNGSRRCQRFEICAIRAPLVNLEKELRGFLDSIVLTSIIASNGSSHT